MHRDHLSISHSIFVHCEYLSVTFLVCRTGMIALHLLEIFVPAPQRLPDLYAALFSIFGAANLCAIYLVGVCWLWWLPSADTQSRKLKNQNTAATLKDKDL